MQTAIVGLVLSQSDILSKQVYLTERIESSASDDPLAEAKPKMHHLKAVVFVRPTGKNIEMLGKLLQSARFNDVHICTRALLL